MHLTMQVETAFDETPSSKRCKAHGWGVVNQSTQKSTITGTVTDVERGTPLIGVYSTLCESENTVQTDNVRNYTMETTFVCLSTFEFSLEGYVTQSIEGKRRSSSKCKTA